MTARKRRANVACAHRGPPGQDTHRQGLVQTALRPLEGVGQALGATCEHRLAHVLGLSPLSMRGHDVRAGHLVGHLCAEVLAHKVQAQVDRRRTAGRGEDVPFVDIEHAGVHLHERVTTGELVGLAPVRRRPAAVEQPGRGQDERSGAKRGDPCPAVMGRSQRRQERRGRARGELTGGDHDRVGFVQGTEAQGDVDRHARDTGAQR